MLILKRHCQAAQPCLQTQCSKNVTSAFQMSPLSIVQFKLSWKGSRGLQPALFQLTRWCVSSHDLQSFWLSTDNNEVVAQLVLFERKRDSPSYETACKQSNLYQRSISVYTTKTGTSYLYASICLPFCNLIFIVLLINDIFCFDQP